MTEQGSPALNQHSPRTVAVIGLGYVGLPLAVLFVRKQLEVYGIDIDQRKIDALTKKHSYLPDLTDEEIEEAIDSGRFHPVTDVEKIKEAEAIIICVPTPLTAYHTPDLSYLQDAAQQIGQHLKKGQLVVLESSTYPGTTKEVLQPILEKASGLVAGAEFYIGYSPERIDPGNKDYTVEQIPKLVSGLTESCCDRLVSLYSRVFARVVRVSSPEVAEMAKILENSQRLINITFINEIAKLCDHMHVDVWEVIEAAATKPFGFTAYYPGPGIGGHCIPVDPLYLQWKSKAYGEESKFIALSEVMNRAMPQYVADQVFELLDRREASKQLSKQAAVQPSSSQPSKQSPDMPASQPSMQPSGQPSSQRSRKPTVLLYGVAYKKDINDVRESPALDLIEILHLKGAKVLYHDPYIEEIKVSIPGYEEDSKHAVTDGQGSKKSTAVTIGSVELTDEQLSSADCVIIMTNHTGIPVERIVRHAPLVFDTRNATAVYKDEPHVFRLGGGK